MKAINDVVQYILNLGPTVMLPIMILIIALIFRVPFGKALRSGLTIGIGFVGINLVIGVLSDNLGPAAQAMVERFGFHLTDLPDCKRYLTTVKSYENFRY